MFHLEELEETANSLFQYLRVVQLYNQLYDQYFPDTGFQKYLYTYMTMNPNMSHKKCLILLPCMDLLKWQAVKGQ